MRRRRDQRLSGTCDQRAARREAEIEQLGAGTCEHDVARLQIAVNDAGAMCLVECRRDLDRDSDSLIDSERSTRDLIGERRTLEVFHDQEGRTLVLTDIEERADVGMSQLRDGAGLAVEPFAQARVGGERFRQSLDGDGSPQARIQGLVDLAHSSGAGGTDDLIWTNSGAGCPCHKPVRVGGSLSDSRVIRSLAPVLTSFAGTRNAAVSSGTHSGRAPV